jgi:hypothetical protein
MLIKLLEALNGHTATMGMLCKTAVARKVLFHAWKSDIQLSRAETYPINVAKYFGRDVDACFLVCSLAKGAHSHECSSFSEFSSSSQATVFGYREGTLVENIPAFERLSHLQGQEHYKWRSGVKHDCFEVMELNRDGDRLLNGFGEVLSLEPNYLYPMLRGSDIRKGRGSSPSRCIIVTQKTVGEDTQGIKVIAPKTWDYLSKHGELLDRRTSRIYRGRPRFSVFGVGDYSFAEWKVAISGFHKSLTFTIVPSFQGRPVVLKDTSYFLPCRTQDEAFYLASLLNSDVAKEFFSAFIFWESKRPITAKVLRRLDLLALARELGSESIMRSHLSPASVLSNSGCRSKKRQVLSGDL